MKKMKVGILGAGNIAETMARTLKSMRGVQAYAVAAREQERAQAFAGRFDIKKAYGSYEEMLADDKVDLVYIATPHSHHYEHAKLCIDYGKPVLCEKSFTVNAVQAEELFAYAAAKKVFITEAIWPRYMPFLKTIRQVVDSGVIGEPKFLSANLSYPISEVPRIIQKELAGGALLDVGVYTVHFAGMLFGGDIDSVSAVCTYTDTGVDEQDSITLTYRDGRMAVLNCSMLCRGDRKGMIHGTNGFIVIENINNFESMSVYDVNSKKIASYKRPKQNTGFEYQVAACKEALEKGWLEYPDIPHAETLRIMKLMDTIRSQWGIRYPMEKVDAVESGQASV